jgi:N-acetylglutamate synthase-like GNAT family acetyltransferase
MSTEPTVRAPEPDDVDRIREVVRSSMTASYALSPEDIDGILEEEFAEDALRERLEDDDVEPLVAEAEDTLVGFVDADGNGDVGTVRWLHVDPERRGGGVGTALFERAVSELDGDAEDVHGIVLASNTSGGTFFEKFGFEEVEDRPTDIADREVAEVVYAEDGTSARADADDATNETDTGEDEAVKPTERDDLDLPDSVATDDGETVYLGDDSVKGSEGGFVVTYTDESRTEEYGRYCVNCESTNVTIDSMDRTQCDDCGNTHKPGDSYDASYL